jgi:Ser/Thr protein kinase RdoA (MazF antagonist)
MTASGQERGDGSPTTGPSVLETARPAFSAEEAAGIASEVFGLVGTAVELGSERDQAFLIEGERDGGVLKISNIREDPAFLDFERRAIRRIRDVDPELPVAQLRPTLEELGAGSEAIPGPTAVSGPDGSHYVRLFDRMRGGNPEAGELSGRVLWDYGSVHARLNGALRGFFHPAAGRELLWDLKQAARLRALLHVVCDRRRRAIVERVLDRYDANVAPEWDRLRAQVVHADFSLDNVLVDEAGRITGIVDFGDMVHTAEIADVAVAVTSLLRGRAGPFPGSSADSRWLPDP